LLFMTVPSGIRGRFDGRFRGNPSCGVLYLFQYQGPIWAIPCINSRGPLSLLSAFCTGAFSHFGEIKKINQDSTSTIYFRYLYIFFKGVNIDFFSVWIYQIRELQMFMDDFFSPKTCSQFNKIGIQ